MYEIHQQRTVLVIPVPEADPLIQSFRAKHIPTPAAAMPPHITVCGPFIPLEQVDERLQSALTAFFASQPQFQFTLQTVRRFPETGVLYLTPEPNEAFHSLRHVIQAHFPEAPSDFHPNRVMHLTLARCAIEDMDRIEGEFYQECGNGLPIEATAREVCLFEKREGAWHKHASFVLAG